MKRRSGKYNAQPTVVDNVRFASKREAKRYGELKLLQKAGKIAGLTLQPRFSLYVYRDSAAGVFIGNQALRCRIGEYIADFQYLDHDPEPHLVIEDVKGFKNPLYLLKKKMVEAIYGITIKEI